MLNLMCVHVMTLIQFIMHCIWIQTFKHIQRNLNDCYHALILNSHHGNTKQVREMDYIFMQDPYGGGGDSW